MLNVENLVIRSGNSELVKGVSFTLKRGEILAVVGESGSGKSLSCLSLLGLLPDGLRALGRAQFTDKTGRVNELIGMNDKLRSELALKKIAFVFQEPLTALNPVQTCGRQIDENLWICGIKDKQSRVVKMNELLKQVGLFDSERILNSYPFQLSGGQRQRIMLAMALAGDPELIIADEPTTALDIILQEEILGLFRSLCIQEGRGMILVSHDLDAVKRYADRVAVMYRGELVESGDTIQVIERPEHTYTKALLACKPKAADKGFRLRTMEQPEKVALAMQTDTGNGNSVILRLSELGKSFRTGNEKRQVLDQISFEIKKGRALGLIGESGSGKSTISRILVKLEKPGAGVVEYRFGNNKPLTSNVQMIFQDPFAALNPSMQIGTMLREVIEARPGKLKPRDSKTEAIELLRKTGLNEDALKKYPSMFSGGQRQRLCIARALAAKPELLICDEATSALDLSVQAQILNLLKDLQVSEGLSILMITHSMAVAAWFCDDLIVLKDGRIVEQGEAQSLIRSPEDPYTRALLGYAV